MKPYCTCVGKTSLSERFCNGNTPLPVCSVPLLYESNSKSRPLPQLAHPSCKKKSVYRSLHCFIFSRNMNQQDEGSNSSQSIALQLWDTAGQERFRSMAPMYYRGAAAAVIVFDLSKEEAWKGIMTWHKDLLAYAEPGVVISIAANKKDLTRSASFDFESCKATCASFGASLHLTSAVTGSVLFFSVESTMIRVLKQGGCRRALRPAGKAGGSPRIKTGRL